MMNDGLGLRVYFMWHPVGKDVQRLHKKSWLIKSADILFLNVVDADAEPAAYKSILSVVEYVHRPSDEHLPPTAFTF